MYPGPDQNQNKKPCAPYGMDQDRGIFLPGYCDRFDPKFLDKVVNPGLPAVLHENEEI